MRDDDLEELPEHLRKKFAAEGDAFEAAGAAAQQRFRIDDLPGLTVSDARRIVEAEGGYFQSLPADDPNVRFTADININRVRAWVRDVRVESADVG